jgi:cation:H+ antiporter
MEVLAAGVVIAAGAAATVWGAELFAEHLAAAAARMGVTSFALALLLAGAEPEELATAVTASLRGAPGVAFGDVVGANVTITLVALGAAGVIGTVPFGRTVRAYALGGLAVAGLAGAVVWDGAVGRAAGTGLIALYVAYVAVIWWRERRPPALGEVGELGEAREAVGDVAGGTAEAVGEASGTGARGAGRRRVGRELVLSLAGVAALAAGSVAIVEAVVRVTDLEETQTSLGLTLVGFATAFELVVLAWSTARRGMPETVVAAVVGSFAYNVTMTLGAAAVARPLRLADAGLLRAPWLVMVASLALVVAVSLRHLALDRRRGLVLLALYPVFVAFVVVG